MKLINLTPHDVMICDERNRVTMIYKQCGERPARVCTDFEELGEINGVPLMVRRQNEVVDLPDPKEGVMYIVSNIVFDFCTDRTDLIAPVQQVKVNGQVIGNRAFIGRR